MVMDPLVAIVLVLVGLFAWGSIAHRLKLRFGRILMIIGIVLVVLIVAGVFVDFSGIFGGENSLARAGAAIVADVKDVFDEGPVIKKETLDAITEDVSDKTEEATKGILNLPTTKSVRRKAS